MKKLSELKEFEFYIEHDTPTPALTKFYRKDDVRAWIINEIKELAEYEEKLINRHGYSALDTEVSEARGARCKLIEMFDIKEEEWK